MKEGEDGGRGWEGEGKDRRREERWREGGRKTITCFPYRASKYAHMMR